MVLAIENLWRISLTSTLSKGYFRDLGIPRPTDWDYKSYSQVTPQSQGAQATQGYINFILIWDRLSRYQLYLLQSYRTNAAGGLLYLTVDRSDGTGGGLDWVDVSAYPGVLQYANMPLGRGNIKTGVQWTFTNGTILNAPASF